MFDLVFIRLVFIAFVGVASYVLQPFGLAKIEAAIAGTLIGLGVVLFEMRLRKVSLKQLIGAVIGSVLGILGAYLFSLVIRDSLAPGSTQRFLQLLVMLLMSYVGLVVGGSKGDPHNHNALGKLYEAKIMTNDFNLNKVAQLRGVEVLNINELANSLKPIVLPGEIMRVFILKEGKEYNQGVAYLDDGTMVVVDNARKMMGKNVDVSVTSVLQTTAGKMIFGKFDERASGNHQRPVETKTVGQDRKTPVPLSVERVGE